MSYDPAEHLGTLPRDPRTAAEIDAAIRDGMLTPPIPPASPEGEP